MKQEEYAEKLAQDLVRALDQGARDLDGATLAQLHARRRAVLAGDATRPAAGQGALAWARHHPWLPVALLAALAGMAWLFQPQEKPLAPEDVDLLLLTEGLPPQAYADWSLVQQDHLGPQCLATN